MARRHSEPVISQVMAEREQTHETRQRLFRALEGALGRTVVSFFTSFRYPVMIEDTDADMLEGILQKTDSTRGLALLINSPGGSGLAAERIINACRNYSGTGDYWAIVPSKAKSAATMICFGASKILMGPTSELGPVDPQLAIPEGDTVKWLSAYNVVQSYDELFRRAVETTGHLEPYLQQLAHYDERDITEYRAQLGLSVDIAVRYLGSGMMNGASEETIKSKIQVFLTPESTKTHGRPIYRAQALQCGLSVDAVDAKSELWRLIHELYIRTNEFVSRHALKCIESGSLSYLAPLRS